MCDRAKLATCVAQRVQNLGQEKKLTKPSLDQTLGKKKKNLARAQNFCGFFFRRFSYRFFLSRWKKGGKKNQCEGKQEMGSNLGSCDCGSSR